MSKNVPKLRVCSLQEVRACDLEEGLVIRTRTYGEIKVL